MESGSYTLDPWHDDRTTLTATGADSATAIAAGLTGLLAAGRAEIGETDEAGATTALAIRAEGANVAELFAGLAAALFDVIDHEEYDVRGVRFDGMVRTDHGLAGWGYALAVPGEGIRPAITVEDVAVTDDGGAVTIRATLRHT
jgi:hypothetical protein